MSGHDDLYPPLSYADDDDISPLEKGSGVTAAMNLPVNTEFTNDDYPKELSQTSTPPRARASRTWAYKPSASGTLFGRLAKV
jgi:hypothetical protein